ncbi:hypothetical protein JCM11641_008441 [Rhodosporidiobolus odoratus]
MMSRLYDPPRHPAAFNLPRNAERVMRSVGKRRRRARYDTDSSSSDDSSGSSSSSDDGYNSRRGGGAAPSGGCSNTVLMLAIVGVFALALAGGAWFYFDSDTTSSSSSSSSNSASSPASTAQASKAGGSSASSAKDSSPSSVKASAASGGSSAAPSSGTASASASAASSSSSSAGGDGESGGGGTGAGMFGVSDDTCGDSGAVDEPVEGGGPNGAQSWLNCGLSKDKPDSKWTPPHIEISALKSVELDKALQLDIFSACKEFEDGFQAASDKNGIPAVMLVAIAMTESSCNKDAKGDNGGERGHICLALTRVAPMLIYSSKPRADAWGLMQILSDKCDGAPSGNCADPAFNINRGAEYFKTVLDQFEGSTLLALGQYNGWYEGLTYNGATKAGASQDTCTKISLLTLKPMQNLDYFEAILNGYMQGVDGQKLATVKNLA